MKNLLIYYRVLLALAGPMALVPGTVQALPLQTAAPITGEIEALTLTTPSNVWSGGTMTIGGQVIILPANLLINLPNDYQSLQQIYANAPAACTATGESGLAKGDRCNARATGAQATIIANRTDSGNIIAGQVDIFKALESVTGIVSYISYSDGYFRLNGIPGDSGTGVMVRVNDPALGNPALGRHTVQKGLGCPAGDTQNCSPDVRFKLDQDNYTFCYLTGYPACIPTTANGLGDPNCPDSNRPPIANIVSSNPFAGPPEAADSRRFAPVKLGDSIKADGSFETVSGVTFLSAWSVRVLVDLTTRILNPLTGAPDPTQPEYLIINEASWDGAAYPAGRVRGRLLTNSSNHNTELDYYSVHYDPVNNAPHEQILYTTQFNKQFGIVVFNVPNGVSDSQIRYDFFPGAAGTAGGKATPGQEPCSGLLGTEPKATGTPVFPGFSIANFCTGNGLNIVQNFNLMVPAFREVMARSTRERTITGVALDIHGRPTQANHYKLPTTIAYGAFEDINLGMAAFPNSFSGTPWLMDRRLSPNGCVGACEATQQPLAPFPYEGIDPRNVASAFGFVVAGVPTTLPTPNRMFAFMDPAGNMTGTLAWPPSNPPAFPILATPGLSFFPPIALGDTAFARAGVPVTIPVLANDIAVFGTIDTASVKIASPPGSGLTQVNPNGTITYTPTPSASGSISFSYTLANNYGSVSQPASVTVSIVAPPVAVNDSASVAAKSAVAINLTANDRSGSNFLNIASVIITSPPTCGSVVNQLDGTVLFSAPATVPAGGSCSFGYVVGDASTPPLLSNTATVTVAVSAPGAAPVAANDFAATGSGSTVSINVIANDTASPGTLNPASLVLDPPNGGTATANPDGTVSYTAPQLPGTYFFAYTVKDNQIPPVTSNPALVVVTVSGLNTPPPNPAPTATNDSAALATNATVVISVLANDSSPAGALNPASLALSAPTGGSAVANADGTVSYSAPGVAGTYSFSYTVQDTGGLTSNAATVTLTVGGQTVAVSRAQFTVNGGAWRVDGTVTPAPPSGTSITLFNSTAVGSAALATVPVNGTAWTWSSGNQSVTTPNAQRKISVQTSQVPPAKLEGITVTFR